MWQKIKALLEKRGQKTAEAQALLDKADVEKRDLSAEENTRFAALTGEVKKLDEQRANYEALYQLDQAAGQQGQAPEQRSQTAGQQAAAPGRGNVNGADEQRSNEAIVGYKPNELRSYSLLRAINRITKNQALDGIEKEASDELAKRFNKQPQGFYMPADLQVETRDLTLTTGSGAKPTITSTSFIDLLRNKTLVRELGALMMAGLTGDFSIPKATGGATAYWVTEGNAPTESNQTIGQVGLAPKTIGAFTDVSRKFMVQSSIDAEQFVRNDLASVLAIEIDRAAVNGSGSGAEPTGILQNSSAPTTAIGTNGGPLTHALVVALETAVANANADMGALAYLTNSKVRGSLKTIEKASSTGQFIWGEGATLNGQKTGVSNIVPSNLTKGSSSGVCSALIFGNFADLVIAMWGGLDILIDPYSASTTGTVRVVALQEIDIKFRNDVSFAKIVDATT